MKVSKKFFTIILTLMLVMSFSMRAFAAASNAKLSTQNVTVKDGFAKAIIKVDISLKNNRYSISKATLSSVQANDISLEMAKNSKCLSSQIASDGSSANVKYSYNIYYWSWQPNDYGGEVPAVTLNYESTNTFQVNIKINSGTGKLTAVYSKVK